MADFLVFISFVSWRFYVGFRLGKGYARYYLNGCWERQIQFFSAIGGWLISYAYLHYRCDKAPKWDFSTLLRSLVVMVCLYLFKRGYENSVYTEYGFIALIIGNIALQFTGHFILVGGNVLVKLWELGDNPFKRHNENIDDSDRNTEPVNKIMPKTNISSVIQGNPLTSVFSNTRMKKISFDDAHKRLLDLKDLLDKGIITQDEFDMKSKVFKDIILERN